MKIAVFGAGSVGGYFGGRLAAAGEEVVFLARGEQLDALRRRGLSIESPKGNLHLSRVTATDRPEEVGPVDVVLLTVKLYDVEKAAAALGPLLGPETVVVALQNGIAAIDLVSRYVGREHLAAGVAYIVAAVTAPGSIRHTAADKLIFGELDGGRSARLVALEAAGQRGGFRASVSETIELDLWTKFVQLSTWSGMTAVTRLPMGVIRDDPALLTMMTEALEEALAVGRTQGIDFDFSIREDTLALVHQFPAGSKSSMLDDLERGRRLELPWLSGTIAELGRASGVPTPIHRLITTVLGPFVHGSPDSGGSP